MDCRLSRREMLRFLTVVLSTALFGYKVIDYFDEELVCVHVYGLSQKLPDPLLERNEKSEKRIEGGPYFQRSFQTTLSMQLSVTAKRV